MQKLRTNNIFKDIFTKFKNVEVGKKAPDFIAEDINRNSFDLKNRLSKRVLLSFFPMAWKKTSTIQMKELGQNNSRLGRYGIVPIGISTDPVLSLKNWKKQTGIGNLKLISDFYPHGDISKKYDVFNKKTGRSNRSNIIIGQDDVIIFKHEYAEHSIPEIEDLINFIEEYRKKSKSAN